jgi:hypothetical protein
MDMSTVLTQVNMCHGSKKRREATNHITYVDPRETMIVKNSWLLNKSLNVNEFSATCS